MKIAIITDDGKTISPHFGRAQYYLVVTLENGKEVSREMRPKLGHAQFSGEPHVEIPGQPHGMDPASQSRHSRMAAAIHDCRVLLACGMGMGAFQNLEGMGVTPILTNIREVDQAIAAYLNGKLEHQPERLH